MSESERRIIIEVADGFRRENNEKTHILNGVGNYEIKAIPNEKNEIFYRGHLFQVDPKVGITAPRFVPSLFGEAHGEERKRVPELGEVLTSTDKASPYVAMTTDYRIALDFLKKRMEQTGIREGYITEIKPNSYLDTRNVLMGARDITEHGMNKNKEVVVAGRVEPKEIKSSEKITNIEEYEKSRKHKNIVEKEELKDRIREETERGENI